MLWTGIPQGRLFSMVGRMVHREPHSNEWLRMNFSTLPTPGMPLLPTGLLPTKSWLRFSSLLTVHRLVKPRHMLSGVAWAWWAVFIRMDPWAVEHQYLPYIPGSWELPVFCPAGHLVRRQSSSALRVCLPCCEASVPRVLKGPRVAGTLCALVCQHSLLVSCALL